MVPRRVLLGATIVCLLVGALGAWLYGQQRIARCAPVPLLAAELLPNADLAAPGAIPGLPAGWARRAGGVELRGPAVDGQGFDLDGDGRALQLLGIANYVQTPPVAVRPATRYCFSGYALTDSLLRSATRARLVFSWHDAAGATLRDDATRWQAVVLWTPEAPPRDWSPLRGSFVAPAGASTLVVRVEPASDDRIYLDVMSIRRGGAELAPLAAAAPAATSAPLPQPARWPGGRRAAVAFTFDWETTMGGLIHSRSVGDPNFDQDPVLRGLRMREGITTTLALFRRYGVRATYYATGYNFLLGNAERRSFLGDPVFSWASPANGWTTERWLSTPWFADDPFGSYRSHPAWYFGDLVQPLLDGGHEIQSHTFSHLYGGLVDAATWQADLQTWNNLAAERGVAPASSLAFPWSGSAGMSDASWEILEQHGIRSVTRLSNQAQYNLFPADSEGLVAEPGCRWLPGREDRILACPDFYLTPERVSLALRQVDLAVAAGGMIDLWAHTEEVTTAQQIAAWERVVRRVAEDAQIWVAPLSEIAAWQTALATLQVEPVATAPAGDGQVLTVRVSNPSATALTDLTLHMPAATQRVAVNGEELARNERRLPRGRGWWPAAGLATFDLPPGQTVEVQVWLAS
ncbi:MAG: polysaccharide deacetylase family protein [Chloroflexi bacterium]|nr:polysaccharide deacetylase family protein [Chloroflexota bacterium]